MKMKICKFSLSVFLFASLCRVSFAQEILFKQFTTENGLSNSYVNCVLQDRTGFIWFGTDDGLNRFDGYEVKVYRNNPDDRFSLSGNTIWAIASDHSGNILIGTQSGELNKFDPQTEKFEHWYLDSASTEEINITAVFEDSKSNIWIGTYKNGLYRFDPSHNKFENWKNSLENPNVLSSNFITSIIEDNDSNIWVSTYSGLDKFKIDGTEKLLTQIISDSQNPIWYLSKSSFFKNKFLLCAFNGLFLFDLKDRELTELHLPENKELEFSKSVSSVVEEYFMNQKILWVGTYGGLARLNLTTGKSTRFIKTISDKSEVLSNQIHDLIVDRSGVVWIATESGLNYHSKKRSKFNFISSAVQFSKLLPELSGKNVTAITGTKDGTVWFGTDEGLLGFKNKGSNYILLKNSGLQSLNIWSLSNGSSNQLWIGTYGQGLKELNLKDNSIKSWKVDNPKFTSNAFNYIKSVLEDDDGMVWIGFWGGGLSRLNPKTSQLDHWYNEINNPSGLSYNDVWVLHKDKKGRIWIGTNGGGLNLYQGKELNDFYNWNASDKDNPALSANNIFSICEALTQNDPDKTTLWIGTTNGLNKFVIKNDNGSSNGAELNIVINHYTIKDGLPDNAIESILEDENGNLWIGTSSGISFFNAEEERFINFTKADGSIGNSFNPNAAFKTKDGFMFFGCISGLNYFEPDRIIQSTYSPIVVITDFKVLNQPDDTTENSDFKAGFFNSKKIFLSHYQNDFSFQFASLDYNAPELNEYAYMLEGFNRDWIYNGKRRFVTYTNLDPGKYVFRVKATNGDGIWSNQTAEIFIEIHPPFWKTWWAYTIYVIAFLSALAFIRAAEIKRREKKEEERLRREREEAKLREAELKAKNIEQEKELEKQKIRNRIAQDLHDEIGSNLSSISLMSELIQKDEKINSEISEKIKRIHKVAKGSTQSIRDIVWLTNPSSDSLKDIIAKMKEVADNTLGKFNLSFDCPQNIVEANLPPDTKRNIFFIYKETLNNIIKHADAKSVDIKFCIENESIYLSIKDDGKGFNTELISSGNGLKNIKSRAKEINAQLRFESSPGKGSLLELIARITQVRD